jgi:3',5'-cyclic AMP phosphodiesterase CpdA
MGYTILHISDLHRSHTDPISNDQLRSSLIADRDRFTTETPSVPPPDAIVISGDLIQGVPLGEPHYSARLAEQYEVASEFLTTLCDQYVDGDRTRVVLVPGNHDVDWNMAFASMHELSGSSRPAALSADSFAPHSNLRWSWEKLAVYRIDNEALYALRLEAFKTFETAFYGMTRHTRTVEPRI